jgi:hypothetical protein
LALDERPQHSLPRAGLNAHCFFSLVHNADTPPLQSCTFIGSLQYVRSLSTLVLEGCVGGVDDSRQCCSRLLLGPAGASRQKSGELYILNFLLCYVRRWFFNSAFLNSSSYCTAVVIGMDSSATSGVTYQLRHQGQGQPESDAMEVGVNYSTQQFCCLFTKMKTQKRKIWQDGRLVITGTSVCLYDAHPSSIKPSYLDLNFRVSCNDWRLA